MAKKINKSSKKSKLVRTSSIDKTINTEKIGQMLKKCTFQSKMTK